MAIVIIIMTIVIIILAIVIDIVFLEMIIKRIYNVLPVLGNNFANFYKSERRKEQIAEKR